MIASFGDRRTEDLFHGRRSGRVNRLAADLREIALRKLDMVHAAQYVEDLASPPGNHLKRLRGDLKGFYSIRVNDQWRIIFRWETGNASDVELIDYH